MSDTRFQLRLTREERFRFTVDFGDDAIPDLVVDEPPPLGGGEGPNPARLLAAAIGNCLAASLLFCLQKSRVPVGAMRASVEGTIVRNDAGRLRIGEIRVRLEPTVPAEHRERIDRCIDTFEDFCIVTQSVRRGLDVDVAVRPRIGEEEAAPVGAASPDAASAPVG